MSARSHHQELLQYFQQGDVEVDLHPCVIDAHCFPVWSYYLDELDGVCNLPADVLDEAKHLCSVMLSQERKPPELAPKLIGIIASLCVAVAARGMTVLVFLPGVGEIECMFEALQMKLAELAASLGGVEDDRVVLALHTHASVAEMVWAFRALSPNE